MNEINQGRIILGGSEEEYQYPKIRPVDAFPVDTDQGQGICIRDPFNIAENPLVVPTVTFYILTMLDGTRSFTDIQKELQQQFQQQIPNDTLRQLLEQLDSELYLETEHFRQSYERIKQEFLDLSTRPAAHAGAAYEESPESLDQQLAEFFETINDQSPRDEVPDNGNVSMLVSPHIDLHRGGPCFAHAYRELQHREPADLYIIFGTGHQCRSSLLTLTPKAYETPFGPVETDREFIERFAEQSPIDVFEEEFLHRDEHSVEFQALFLRYILGEQWKGRIVPILCGSFHPYVHEGVSPRTNQRLAESLDQLRSMIEDYPGRVSVIAGVDLSHVGKKFGHEEGLTDEQLQQVTQEDENVLQAIKSGDAENFYRTIEAVKDQYNVCGLSPIYMSLDVVRPQTEGRILKYDQAIENETESVVTFTSAAFYS